MKEAIEFSFGAIKQGTLAEDAKLEIEMMTLGRNAEPVEPWFSTTPDTAFFVRCAPDPSRSYPAVMQVEYVDLA